MDKVYTEEYINALFGEKDFLEKMNTVVEPFLKEYVRDGYFESYDGKSIHYYQCINPKEKASVVVSHGFCEFFQKYEEVVYELFRMGYSVFFIEHRGHGKSYRDVPQDMDLVHIESYNCYIKDLKVFMDSVVTKQSLTGNYYMFAHSMGGCIGSLFLEKYPSYFKAAVLSSPMLQMNIGKTPYFLAKLLMIFAKLFRQDKKYAPGQFAFDYKYIFKESGTLSEARYSFTYNIREKCPEYRTYGGSYGWSLASMEATRLALKHAQRIKIPVLLFQAGRDDMVVPKGQDAFVSKVEGAKKIVFSESKHEIYNATHEIRIEYYEAVMHFFGSQDSN